MQQDALLRWCVALAWVISLVLIGGGMAIWARGVTLAGTGLFLLLAPWQQVPPRWWSTIGLCLAGIILLSILPLESLAPDTQWRQSLQAAQVTLPASLSPQPIVTLEAALCWLSAWLWLGWCLSNPLPAYFARNLVRWFIILASLLALILILGQLSGNRYFLATDTPVFSFFPNRNQMACWLAMAGTAAFAMMLHEAQKHKKRALFWLLALLCLGTASALSLSRGGLVAFVAGCLMVIMLYGTSTWRVRLISGISLLALFLLAWELGAPSIQRLEDTLSAQGSLLGLRGEIYQDAWKMTVDGGLLGHGMGQFQALFPHYQNINHLHTTFIHPESDVFWWLTELGWSGFACAVATLVCIIHSLWHKKHPVAKDFHKSPSRVLIQLSAAALVAFSLHSLVDVGAHRLGTVYTACFLLGIALADEGRQPPKPLLQVFSRLLALPLLLTGAAWITSSSGIKPLHSVHAEATALQNIRAAMEDQNPQALEAAAVEGLRWRPLSWKIHFLRAKGLLYSGASVEAASSAFAQARALAPANPEVPLREGEIWANMDPPRAIIPWAEALRRPIHDPGEVFLPMIVSARNSPALQHKLRQLALEDPRLLPIWLNRSRADEFEATLRKHLLSASPMHQSLDKEELERLLIRWLKHADTQQAKELLEDFPQLAQQQWHFYARVLASNGDYAAACQRVLDSTPYPALPSFNTQTNPEFQLANLRRNPSDIVALTTLTHHYESLGQKAKAIQTLEQLAVQLPQAHYIHHWKARLYLADNQEQLAWQSLLKWLETI